MAIVAVAGLALCSPVTQRSRPTLNLRSSFWRFNSLVRPKFSSAQTSLLPRISAIMGSKTVSAEGRNFYDFEVEDIKGNKVSLGDYKGKVALIVNVASQCGLTNSNYTELTQLYEKYKNQGFTILAFPSNQFGGQEPGANQQIEQFACTRYKASFPLFAKVDVNGPSAAPVYKFLKSQKGGGLLGDDIKWNFGKFLVDKEGNVVGRYAPTTSPFSIEADIKKLL